MQNVDVSDLLNFDRELAIILDEMPAERAALHEEIGDIIKQDVDAAISASGLNDQRGNVRRYQIKHVGTRGGYAAVRAVGSKDGAETGPNSPGAVTNYLTSGHSIPPPRGGKGYRPRIRVSYVQGYHFYDAAQTSTEGKTIRKVQEYVDRLSEKVEGS